MIRQTIVTNRDVAELMSVGLGGKRDLDAADQLRLEHMLDECAFAAFHVWIRTKRGIFPKGTFKTTAGAYLCGLLRTARGSAWWNGAKQQRGFMPAFVTDVDALLAKANEGSSMIG